LPFEAKKINKSQIFESLIRKNLERMKKFDNSFDRNADFTKVTAHYTLLIFMPLCNDYLSGKIDSA
jgi:hypothetical protein